MDYKFKLTTNGRKVIVACMDTGGALQITRAAVGKGRISEDAELADQHELIDYVADATIADRRHEDDRVKLSVQYSNLNRRDIPTFYLSEFIVYVTNPDTGEETDLLYATLGDYPQPIPQFKQDYPASVFNFPLVIILSDEINVYIEAPVGLVTYDELTELIYRLDVTIPTTGWQSDLTAGDRYNYSCDIAIEGAKERMIPFLTILPDSYEAAWACDLSYTAQTMIGKMRVYAGSIPTSEINASLLLLANPPYIRGNGSSGDLQAGVGLSRSEDGKLNVNLGDGISVDNSNKLTVDRATVLTDADMLDEDETAQEIKDILLS